MVFWLDYLLLVYGLDCVCGVVNVCALWCLVLLVAIWVLGSVVLCYSVRRWVVGIAMLCCVGVLIVLHTCFFVVLRLLLIVLFAS